MGDFSSYYCMNAKLFVNWAHLQVLTYKLQMKN